MKNISFSFPGFEECPLEGTNKSESREEYGGITLQRLHILFKIGHATTV